MVRHSSIKGASLPMMAIRSVFSFGIMSEGEASTSATASSTAQPPTPVKRGRQPAASKTKKPKPKSDHPKVADMVIEAVGTLKDRGGSSSQAIKKFIGAHYAVEVDRLAHFIRRALKTAVANGTLVQTRGKGASGSFKLAPSEQKKGVAKTVKSPVKVQKPKPKAAKTPTKAAKSLKRAVKSPGKAVKVTAKKTAKSPKAKTARKAIKVKTPKPKSVKKTPMKAKNRKVKTPAKKMKATKK